MKIRFNPKAPVTQLHIEGHKLAVEGGGAGDRDDYAHGRCQCGGWRFNGWSTKQSDVRRAHQRHLRAFVGSLVGLS